MNTEARTDESPHLTIPQLAKRWHTTPQAIYNMRHRGKAPLGFKRGREVLVPLVEVEAYEAAGLAADLAPSHEQRPPEPKLPPRGRKTLSESSEDKAA